jgi:nitroreductase
VEVFEAVRTLRAVRAYREEPVPEEVLRRVLEAGRLSASGMNKQPWRFVVVEERATLERLGAALRSGPYVADAAAAIVVAIEPSRLAVSDASRAIQSMLLVAWEAGIGSNWVGFGGLDGVRDLLDIPADLDVLAVLPLGYPADGGGRGAKERKPLAEIAHRGRWGEPFA